MTEEKKITRNRSKWFVYCLLDPITNVPRYVGLSMNPSIRLGNHVNGSGQVPAVTEWIDALKEHGLSPKIFVLQECDGWNTGFAAESKWISRFSKRFGTAILNRNSRMDRNDVRALAKMRSEILRVKRTLAKMLADYSAFICERSGVEDVGFFRLPEIPKRKHKYKKSETDIAVVG